MSSYIFVICAEILAILVRNANDIKDINIDEVEYLISQYADDTRFMLDGSLKSLNNTLLILKYYANISGLKLNYAKTKVIWIGSKRFSKDVFHHTRWKLQWGITQINLLGILFSVNLENIVELNYETKLLNMKTSIKLWSIRKLTALGRITVLKTIIIPKLTYLFISLPNPSNKLLKSINDIIFKFIWQNKHDKLKRDLMTQEDQDGGIKMINITNFIAAFKAARIRRVLMNHSKWHTLFQVSTGIIVNDIVIYGDRFIKKRKNK